MSFKDFDISMAVPGLPFNGESLEKHSLGGSETAAVYMAKALAKAGARVTVFCNTAEPGQDVEGARYMPLGLWSRYSKGTPHDVSIVQRLSDLFSQRSSSRLNLLWCHDLAHGRSQGSVKAVSWNIDKVLVLSEFMREQYAKTHGYEGDHLYLTRNGVDLETFKAAEISLRNQMGRIERDYKRLVYVSRPERGLDVLLRDVMPKLLERDPEIRLAIGGYENPVPNLAALYEECDRLAAKLGDRVERLPPLAKKDLYREYMLSGVYVYPTPSPHMRKFREISCITAMECLAAGLPFVASDAGALRETVGEPCGEMLVPLKDGLPDVDGIVEKTLLMMNSGVERDRVVHAGRERASLLDWSGVAKDWLEMFERELRAGNSNPERAVRYFWRTSDIVAAKQILNTTTGMDPSLETLLEPWFFMDEPEGYRKQYERIGLTHGPNLDPTATEPRFKLIEKFLGEHKDISTVIDYGCAHGGIAVNLALKFPRLNILGLDIDKHGIDLARRYAAEKGVSERAEFQILDVMNPSADDGALAGSGQCALIVEVLEHVTEPWTVAERVEKLVAKGGKVYITVPFGPWEYDSYHTYPHRCHVWHFDRHDLTDMFGDKPKMKVDAFYQGDGIHSGEALGLWIVSYEADHEPVRRIDVERKLWLQRPRQTVSVGMIAGPGCEETIAWTLRSVYHIADEIVIGDTGMGPALKDMLQMLDNENPLWSWPQKVRVVDAPDPKRVGFDVSRNAVLDASRMDWFMWIDTDERFIGATALWKYLRENLYHGYGVRQHHFAVDTNFQPDMPVRLFRRRPLDGQTMRFHGAIHEHPELKMNEGPGPIVVLSDIHIAHTGYLIEEVRQRRFLRNWPLLKMDQERNPTRVLSKHMLMRDNIHLVRYTLGQNGQRVDPDVERLCRETVALYREYFMGKPGYTNTDSLQYYSEALKVLGEGFDVAWQFEAAIDKDPQVNGTSFYRFANTQDLLSVVNFMVKEKAEKFDAEYY